MVLNTLVEAVVFVAGFVLVAATFMAAVRTVVVPRAENVWMTRMVYRTMIRLFRFLASKADTYEQRDGIMAYYSPISVMLLVVAWLAFTTFGFTAMLWAVGVRPWLDAFWLSGSNLLTLGFMNVDTLPQLVLSFADAALGLIYIALLIAYLPTIYTNFSRRETMVNMLEVRAGIPPSPVEMLKRLHRIGELQHMDEIWERWETWFVEIEETHTSLPMLIFFRSIVSHRSWVTAAGVVMDGAALSLALLDRPFSGRAAVTIRSGYIALRAIADFLRIDYDPDPAPTDPISIRREEFNEVVEELREAGLALKADIDQAWADYSGWRVNYDSVLLALAAVTMAPYARWVSDRSLAGWRRSVPELSTRRRQRGLGLPSTPETDPTTR